MDCCRESKSKSGYPVDDMTFEEATAYCAHQGGVLPSEAQWLAAHGAAKYPWGDKRPTCERVHGAGCSDRPQPVGVLLKGSTKNRVHDMAGNVWEWVRDADNDAAGVLVGGSVESQGGAIGRGSRIAPGESRVPAWTGARCAYDAEP